MSEEQLSNEAYKVALNVSLKSVRDFFIITAVSSFLYGSRTIVWVEYAKSFKDSNIELISWTLYIDSLLIGIAGLVFAALGDHIGFDKAITLKLCLITIGCIVESVANNFIIYSIGFLISQTAAVYVSIAYISWILPTTKAKTQIALLFAACSALYLFGTLFSGIIFKIFSNYRIIFILNSIFMSITLLFSLKIYNTQQNIEHCQIECHLKLQQQFDDNICADSNDLPLILLDEEFPSYQKYNRRQVQISQSFLSFFKDVPVFNWYIMIQIIIEMGILASFEAVLLTYYVAHILDKYMYRFHVTEHNEKQNVVLFSSLQMMLMALSFVVTCIIFSVYTQLLNTVYKYVSHHLLLIIFYVLLLSLCSLFLCKVEMYYYWIYTFLFGIFIAAPSTILEYNLLDVQPKEHSGKINGIKSIISNIIRAFLLLIVGLLWNTSMTHNALLYVIIITCIISIILRSICWCIIIFRNNRSNYIYSIVIEESVTETDDI